MIKVNEDGESYIESENILILGNGFDRHHNLNSSYKEFVKFYSVQSNVKEIINEFNDEKYIDVIDGTKNTISNIVQSNEWLKLINLLDNALDDRWQSLEDLIGIVLKYIKRYDDECQAGTSTVVTKIRGDIVAEFIFDEIGRDRSKARFTNFAKLMDQELRQLTFLLQKYLLHTYKNTIIEKDDDIQNLINSGLITHVISFNYTDTLKDNYLNKNKEIDICHIHGSLDKYSSMVFGTDAQINDSESKAYYPFQKYYQRIVKQSDTSYLEWADNTILNGAVFYGFSFGVADADIINLLYENCERFYIIYHDKKSYSEIASNLAAVLGKTELTKGFNSRKIVFSNKLNYKDAFSLLEEVEFEDKSTEDL